MRTRFTGALRAHENGTLYPVHYSDDPVYVGPPSPEIDAAWEELLQGRYAPLLDAEVDKINSDNSVPNLEPIGEDDVRGFFGGPDMLHSLHCINSLRRQLDPGYYKDSESWLEEYGRMHIEHCIEQLRQAVMCYGDTTPVTLKAVRNAEGKVWGLLGETEREHTCRDWRSVREWATERWQCVRSGDCKPKIEAAM